MNLFGEEIINISNIHTVIKLDSKSEIPNKKKSYNASLFSYELVFYISGDININFNGTKMRCTENSLVYLPKAAKNQEYSVNTLSDGIYIDVYFDTLEPMPENPIIIKDIPELKNLFAKIYNIWASKKSGYYLDCMSVFLDIIKIIKGHKQKYTSKLQSDKISASHKYLLENFKNYGFDYKEMCKKSGFSYSYFKELFISKYKMSPVKYLTHLKIDHAKELLITGKYTITEVAERCGFENVYYFSTVFKRQVGISPKQYKNI